MDVSGLIAHKLLIVTGKGGVGKTLVSACLGRAALAEGKRVCIVGSTAYDQIGPLLGYPAVGHDLSGFESDRLYLANLRPELNFRDFITLHLGFKDLFDKLFSKAIVRSFIRMIPGINELCMLGRLYNLCELDEERRFDLVIFDGYASGHLLSLLQTPQAIMDSGLVGPVVRETSRVKDYLENPTKTALVWVGLPEELVVSESLEFMQALQERSGIGLGAVVLNRLLPELSASLNLAAPQLAAELQGVAARRAEVAIAFEEGLMTAQPEVARHKLFHAEERFFVPEPLDAAYAQEFLASMRQPSVAGKPTPECR